MDDVVAVNLHFLEHRELSGIQARKRVSAGSFKKLLKRLVSPPGAGDAGSVATLGLRGGHT